MSATEDESQQLDAGWDDEEPSEEAVDEAWDSVAPAASAPVSSVSSVSSRPSLPVATEEVDGGWDDVPDPIASDPAAAGKRRPHRQRRAKSGAVAASVSPVLRPRPAEKNKKQQREHARKQRAYEAQAKEQRKLERKAQRAAELRAEAEERGRLAEAAELARRLREEARDRARSERPAPKPRAAAKPKKAKPPEIEVERGEAEVGGARSRSVVPKKRAVRPGVIIALVVAIVAVALLLARR